MTKINIDVQRLPHGENLPLPEQATKLAAGVDLLAAVEQTVKIEPGERKVIPTGIAVAVPLGYEAQVRPRSGLAVKFGITLANSPGTIDSDYRGEIGAILINHGEKPFIVERGMRIAQMIVAPVTEFTWNERKDLDKTERGTGGFGSTGMKS